jgi:hypothetical protein
MTDAPVSRVVNDANINAVVEDARGREIAVRFPGSFLRMVAVALWLKVESEKRSDNMAAAAKN